MGQNLPGLKAAAPADCDCGHDHAAAVVPPPVPGQTRVTLFATETCPNCRIAKTFLDKANIAYDVVICEKEEDKAIAMDIRQAPTLVVEKDGKVDKFVNLSDIRRFIDGK